MTRASTSAGRQSSAKPDNNNVGAKRKPGDEDIVRYPKLLTEDELMYSRKYRRRKSSPLGVDRNQSRDLHERRIPILFLFRKRPPSRAQYLSRKYLPSNLQLASSLSVLSRPFLLWRL